ncbi:MAG: hypothetical protein WCV83_01055 [Candidatus Magasanikbacteria bacterium]|jgi:hypothetical protein
MLSLRAKLFIVISLIVLFILGISIFLLFRAKKQTTTENPPTTTENTAVNNGLPIVKPVSVTNIVENVKVNPVSALEIQQNAAQQIAKIFLERYNSFSSESQYQNVRDVQTLVSKAYWIILSAKLSPVQPPKNTIAQFSSTITKVYSIKLASWSELSAIVDLQVKISEEKNGLTTNKDQQAKVYLVKEGENWLVDKFEWVK